VLRDGDRVELLRPLAVAPMDARRARYRKSGGVQAIRARNAKPPKGGAVRG
jgi:putative ubiquitin-RnfH superfamily antitoxin RatB of RatAB toxin-antitoxin module